MAEEPTLPRLPAVAWDSETQSFARNNTRHRKRAARDTGGEPPLSPAQFSTSSDPAVFSSDDDPHVDNYAQGGRHRKKRYVGSWYQQHPASLSSDSALGSGGGGEEGPTTAATRSRSTTLLPPKKAAQRTFQRQFDSGVWMGSDGFTEDDDDEDEDTIMEPDFPEEPRLPQFLGHARAKAVVALSPAEEFARQKIQEAIDTGNEVIDLSGLDLEELSSETISRLSEFSCIPLVAEDVPFEQRDPALKLYLARNPLPRAPGAIFNLEFLTVLSLRNTQVTELPPSIANLRNLTDLNVSLNRLQYLPGELLDLLQYPGKLLNLSFHPNPFCHPERLPTPAPVSDIVFEDFPASGAGAKVLHEVTWANGDVFRSWLREEDDGLLPKRGGHSDDDNNFDVDPAQIQHLDRRRWQLCAIARSPVQYSDSRGVVLSKFELPVPIRELTTEDDDDDSPTATTMPSSEQLPPVTVQTEDLGSVPAPLLRTGYYSPPQTTEDDHNTSTSTSSPGPRPGPGGCVPSLFELALRACTRSGQLRELPAYLPAQTPARIRRVLHQLAARSEDGSTGDVRCSVCKRGGVAMPTTAWIEWWEVSRTVALPESGAALQDPVSMAEQERFLPFLRRGCSWRRCVPRPMRVGQLRPGSVRWSRTAPPDVIEHAAEEEEEDDDDV